MFFERVKTAGIAHNAYVVGDGGEAAIIDPRRDVAAYLDLLRANDLTLRYVIETHRQEDFVMGSAPLREATGAAIVAGDHPLSAHADRRLRDGEEITLGALRLRALHTPGHTPESMSYALFIPDAPDLAWGVFSGDALFIGETGRADLADPEKTAENAGILHDAAHRKIFPLGDQALLFPAHGAGSVCGGGIAARDESTLGLEKLYNPVWRLSRADFMRRKAAESIPRPPYFSLMERINLAGGAALSASGRAVRLLPPAAFAAESDQGIVIDTRAPEAFAGGHSPSAYSVWLGGLPVFGGWVAREDTPIYLILQEMAQLDTAIMALARIGLDEIAGVLAGGFEAWRDAGLPLHSAGTVAPLDLARRAQPPCVLDVREQAEFEAGHIEGARHCYVGELEQRLPDFAARCRREDEIVVTCSVGNRASLALSILRRNGFAYVSNLLGGMTAWNALGLPMRKKEPAGRHAA